MNARVDARKNYILYLVRQIGDIRERNLSPTDFTILCLCEGEDRRFFPKFLSNKRLICKPGASYCTEAFHIGDDHQFLKLCSGKNNFQSIDNLLN